MGYEKEIGKHLAGIIKEIIEAEHNEVKSGTASAMKKRKLMTNPGACAVVEEAKKFRATPQPKSKRRHQCLPWAGSEFWFK